MKLHAYLNYGGNCAEAFRFYEKHLGARVTTMMTHEGQPLPPGSPAGWEKAVLYASLEIGGTELRGSDVPHAEPMRSVYLSLSLENTAGAEQTYALLADGGEIFMPMAETFFAHRFGMLRDRFGTSWMILHEKAMGA